MLQFIEDCCDIGPCEGEPTGSMYAAWSQWAADNGHRPNSASLLGTRLRAVNGQIERKRRRTDGDREYFYSRIQLNPTGVELLEKKRRRENVQK